MDYFSNLLGGEISPPMLIQSDMNLLLPFRCSPNQVSEMEVLFSDSDIKAAFHSLPRNKTCGPDGFSAEFFIGSWEIEGVEVTEAVKEFFSSRRLLTQWNTTSLVFIPEITNASKTN